ncbi:MAG: hypothetical protein J6M19_05095 [Bacteroidaceae bacterium]|nr:hypothetical protein [Bacteroidaceae bacterium]
MEPIFGNYWQLLSERKKIFPKTFCRLRESTYLCGENIKKEDDGNENKKTNRQLDEGGTGASAELAAGSETTLGGKTTSSRHNPTASRFVRPVPS